MDDPRTLDETAAAAGAGPGWSQHREEHFRYPNVARVDRLDEQAGVHHHLADYQTMVAGTRWGLEPRQDWALEPPPEPDPTLSHGRHSRSRVVVLEVWRPPGR
jgi:hypothetical protein